MTEGKIRHSTFESGFWSMPMAVVCSSGRGAEVRENVGANIREIAPGILNNIISISPDVEISPQQEPLLSDILKDRPDRNVIRDWLHTTAEGRPGQVIYSDTTPLNQLGSDLLKIAGGKLRVAAMDLLHCYQIGIPNVKRLYVSRDTGQVIKIRDRDIVKYQSHPGEIESQREQAQELIEAERGVLMTATVLLGGIFPTSTKTEIYQALSFLFSIANIAATQPEQIAHGSQSKIVREVQYATFKVRAKGSGYHWPSDDCLKNVPGGLDFSNRRVSDCLYVYMKDGQVVRALPTNETFGSIATDGAWEFYQSGAVHQGNEYMPFSDMRKGMLTNELLRRALFSVNQVLTY